MCENWRNIYNLLIQNNSKVLVDKWRSTTSDVVTKEILNYTVEMNTENKFRDKCNAYTAVE